MTELDQTAAEAPPVVTPKTMRRVASVSMVGTLIEFYDFFIYATAAALVFPHLFFPALGSAAGTVASFATLGVAFVARPLGSIIFGHIGDRLGRKKTLVVTLLMMGMATLLIGFLPTAAQIGVAAPIAIVVLRVIQGLAAGGEWAGAVLYAAEYAPGNRRGFWTSFAPAGGGLSLAVGNLVFIIVGLSTTDEQFMSWGWRIPFLISAVLIVVGLYIRLRTAETPVFQKQIADHGTSRVPLIDAFRSQPYQVLLGAGATMLVFVLYFVGSTFLVNFGTVNLKLNRDFVLTSVMIGGVAYAVCCLTFGRLSDTYGRRRMLIIAAVVGVAWMILLFPLINTGSPIAFAVGAIGCIAISGMGNGPLGSFLSELYQTHYRYTATALSYNIAGVLGGGIPPLVIASLFASYGASAVTWFVVGLGLLSIVCLFLLVETKTRRLEDASREATKS